MSFNDTVGSVIYNNLDMKDVPSTAVTCIFPLSGSYGFLARILYYVSLLIVVFSHRVWYWLVAGAGAGAMTYSGTAAVHACILVALPRTSTFDLDSIGTYVISSTALIFIVPIMSLSETMRRRSVRHILRAWAFLMAAGTACATAALIRPWPVQKPCTSNETSALLTSPLQLDVASFNCTYSCFATGGRNTTHRAHNLLRSVNETLAIQVGSFDTGALSRIQEEALIIATITIFNFLFFIILWTKNRGVHKDAEGALFGTNTRLGGLAGWLMLPVLFSPLLMIGNIVVAELFFRSSDFAKGENISAVGQWSVVASAGLVGLGTAIDRWFVSRDERKEAVVDDDGAIPLQPQGYGMVNKPYATTHVNTGWRS